MLITAMWAVAYLNINTAYVHIPALCNTLTEKHVTKILKYFTISASPCITFVYTQCTQIIQYVSTSNWADQEC